MARHVMVRTTTLEEVVKRLSELEHDVEALRQRLLAQTPHVESNGVAPVHTPTASAVSPGTTAGLGHWDVTCLARFQLRCAGRAVPPCRSRRGQSILQYLLASRGYAATTDALLEVFWPDMDPAAGMHNLHMAIHALRLALRGCGPDGSDQTILFHRERYLLNPALSIVQDVDRFRAAYNQGMHAATTGQVSEAQHALEEARRWYAGEYLADNPYEEWTQRHRAVLQDMYLSVLSQLSTFYSQASAWERAADCCREILAVDPYHEEAYRQLMRCQAAYGRIAEVQRTYWRCKDRLRRDLQLDPAAETVLLYQQLVQPQVAVGV